jgi:hypothetical protein
VAKQTGLVLQGSYLNLDGAFDARHNRKAIFNVGLMPNIPENPRHRQTTKHERKRCFNQVLHALRDRASERLRGRTSSSGCCYDLSTSNVGITA